MGHTTSDIYAKSTTQGKRGTRDRFGRINRGKRGNAEKRDGGEKKRGGKGMQYYTCASKAVIFAARDKKCDGHFTGKRGGGRIGGDATSKSATSRPENGGEVI